LEAHSARSPSSRRGHWQTSPNVLRVQTLLKHLEGTIFDVRLVDGSLSGFAAGGVGLAIAGFGVGSAASGVGGLRCLFAQLDPSGIPKTVLYAVVFESLVALTRTRS
jgi:hypothetical protein